MDFSHRAEFPAATAMDQKYASETNNHSVIKIFSTSLICFVFGEMYNSLLSFYRYSAIPSAAVQDGEGVANPSIQNVGQERVQFDITGSEKLDGVSKDPGPSSPAEMRDPRHSNDNSPEIIPDIEIMREAVPDISVNLLHSPNFGNDIAEPQASLDRLMNEKETISPIFENNLTPRGQTQPFQPSSEPRASVASLQEDLVNNSPFSFGNFIKFFHYLDSLNPL